MEIIIKQAKSEDVPMLRAIAQLTFPLAGPLNSSKKEIDKYIAIHFNESVFQQLLESDEAFIACAQSNNEVVGFIVMKFSSSHPEHKDLKNVAELQRLYVHPEYHGSNVSKLLVIETFKEMSERGANKVWLSVYSKNKRAQNFYNKFGFEEIGTTHFKMGNERHLDTLMLAHIA